MALPPLDKRIIPSTNSPIPAAEKKAENAADLSYLKAQIIPSKKERDKKIEKLSGPYQKDAITFLTKVEALEKGLITEVRNCYKEIKKKSTSSREDRQKYDDLAKQVKSEIAKLEQDYKKYNFFSDFLTTLVQYDEVDEGDILFNIEAVLTSVINSIFYKQEVETFIEEHKKQIVDEFYKTRSPEVDLKSLKFDLTLVKGETHHLGKVPVFITFRLNGSNVFTVVYKPRNAGIDKAVIDTFDEINRLPEKHKSIPDALLPVYKIVNFSDASIWEYIDGQDVDDEKVKNVAIFIARRLANTGERLQKTQQALNRMDAILTRMGISDLHKENIKIKYLQDQNKAVEIIPIDLENRQKNHETQLGGKPSSVKLTPEEEAKIENSFNRKVTSLAYRYLPLNTQLMAVLIGDFRDCETLAKKLMDQFEADKLQIQIKLSGLKDLLFRSFLSHDVPYFTNFNGIIYYGLPKDGHVIAKERSIL